jgi:hypothetical protein
MPNAFALLMLALWPALSWGLFRSLPPGRAILASLIVAYMILPPPPAAFDFPLLPALTKETIPALTALILCVLLYRPGIAILPRSAAGRGLVALFVLCPVPTILTNTDPVFWGTHVLPALRPREALGMMVGQVLLIAPFLMARAWLSRPEDQRDLLWALLIGGLVYSLPMLLEVRLAPQLNIWIYGYFQHVFGQMMRGDGFRPIVFMQHGLWVAFFAMMAVVAAAALWRAEDRGRKGLLTLAGVWMFAVLVLCKSLASLAYAVLLVPLVLLLPPRAQIRLALILCLSAIAYPAVKGAHLVPADDLTAAIATVAPERAQSLDFRFQNEERLLERAEERPLFGWGLWGRNHLHDPQTGQMTTVTDGRWVLVLGSLGWFGFLAEFLLLTLPVALLWWRTRAGIEAVPPLAGPLALLLGVNMVDLIPNATVTPLTWLIAGALLGYAERHVPVFRPRPAPIQVVM